MTYYKTVLFSILALVIAGCAQFNISIEDKVRGVVLIENILKDKEGSGLGTGFFIDENTIITNNHVVDGEGEIKIALESSSKLYEGKVIFKDSVADIAIVQVVDWESFIKENNPIEYLTLTDKLPKRTQEVYAIGNPWGLVWSVSKGIVSYELRRSPDGSPVFFIQTDGDIFNGNSGGPLVDNNGNVLGVNAIMIAKEGGSYGFAITSELVRKILEDQKKYGYIKWPLLGISIEEGSVVKEISPNSPAEAAGLLPGDEIKTIDNNRGVYKIDDINHLIYRLVTGVTDEPVIITFERNEKLETVSILPNYRKTEELPTFNNK